MRPVVALLLALAGCGPQTGARIAPLEPRQAVVGQELRVVLVVEGAGADAALDWDADIADLKTRRLRPTLERYAGGEAIFRWTPLADDAGAHTLRFTVTADGATAQALLALEVLPGMDPLVFRRPVGDGTTLDLARERCAVVEISVEDTVATSVVIERGTPWSEGGTLTQDAPLAGRLELCPTAAQAQRTSVFPFAFVATDARGARAEKRYTIVLGAVGGGP